MTLQITHLFTIVMTLNLILTPPLAAIDSDDEENPVQAPPAPLSLPPQLTDTGEQKGELLPPKTSPSQNDQVMPPPLSSTLEGHSMPIRYTRSLGVVKQAAQGLTEVRQAFTGTLNAASEGNINGTVLRADVVTKDGYYTVKLIIGDQIGSQTFIAENILALHGNQLRLTSTSNPFNHLVFDYSTYITNLNDPASFRKAFRTLLGLTKEGTPARFTSKSSGFSVDGIMSAISHPTTPPGTYIAQYMDGGRMYLDNGYGTVESVEVPEDAHSVTFPNGITVELGYAFEPTEPMPQVGIVVE